MEENFNEEELAYVQRAEKYCSASEQCLSSVRAKLLIWGAKRPLAERILNHLTNEGFIDEQRYANAYCLSKVGSQKWGRIKVIFQLRSKQLPQAVIDEAIRSIDPEVYRDALVSLGKTKWETLPKTDVAKSTKKLQAFLATKGFEMDVIQENTQAITEIEAPTEE